MLTWSAPLRLLSWSEWLPLKQIRPRYAPDKLRMLKEQCDACGDELFIKLIFLRVMPLTPHWLVNAMSSHVNIAPATFATSIFIGLIPFVFLDSQASPQCRELRFYSTYRRPRVPLVLIPANAAHITRVNPINRYNLLTCQAGVVLKQLNHDSTIIDPAVTAGELITTCFCFESVFANVLPGTSNMRS